jgi:hypothetical protein
LQKKKLQKAKASMVREWLATQGLTESDGTESGSPYPEQSRVCRYQRRGAWSGGSTINGAERKPCRMNNCRRILFWFCPIGKTKPGRDGSYFDVGQLRTHSNHLLVDLKLSRSVLRWK